MTLILVFILGFVAGVFSPLLPDLSAMLLDKIDHARAQWRARINEVQDD